jgi:hypothetical protein
MAKKKKLTRAEKIAAPLSEDLKIRVIQAKKRLPVHGLTALYFHYFTCVNDTVKNRSKLSNVLQTRATDETTTNNLEDLVKILDPKTNFIQ